ncbi:Peptidase M30 [Treponema bryantii]|uniref:Peptidase M30 n=1 Tax=Treponema bryantii TaxID=163 RepID=A0A1I3IYG7_9SPIR|nr:hypothetical protein [Treponema bryantii]SFI52913.1 Peptidase M30 [Treponema bryantii]
MKKLLFLASALSVLLLASCSNTYQEEATPIPPKMSVPTEGKEAFIVIQNQTPYGIAINENKFNTSVVQNYIKAKEEAGEKVIIPKRIDDVKISMDYIRAYHANKKFGINKSINGDSSSPINDDRWYKNINDTDINHYERTFYTENGNTTTEFDEPAVLKAIGEHCYVWYKEKNSIDLGSYDFNTLAEKFDSIYERETFIFGSNIPNPDSSVKEDLDEAFIYCPDDEKTKIHILVYDLEDDYETNSGAVLMGYFWSLDFCKNSFINPTENNELTPFSEIVSAFKGKSSNECQCIHIDSGVLKDNQNEIYSTLGHEFQHLLHFVNKTINTASVRGLQWSDTWYNEMMSMVCEDLMLSHLHLTAKDGPQNRLGLFNQTYYAGFTNWFDGDDCLISYANAYAFGAFILRNWGIECIRNIALNKYINQKSILDAVHDCDSSITSFYQIQKLFYNVMLNPTATEYTLNKSVSKKYDSKNDFTCEAINLNNYITFQYNEMDTSMAAALYGGEAYKPYKGPMIINLNAKDGIDRGFALGPTGTLIVYTEASNGYAEVPGDWNDSLTYYIELK